MVACFFLQISLFSTYDSMCELLQIATGVLSTLTVNKKRCEEALSSDMLATDLAYYLVRKGVPFREAHSLSGKNPFFLFYLIMPINKYLVKKQKTCSVVI